MNTLPRPSTLDESACSRPQFRPARQLFALQRIALGALVLTGAVACGGGGGGGSGAAPASTPVLFVTPNTIYQGMSIEGGAVTPATMDYVVKNTGSGMLVWSADTTEVWGSVAPTDGLLAAGDEIGVTFSIDVAIAQGLPPGLLTASVDFINESNGVGSTSTGLVLNIVPLERALEVTPATGLTVSGPRGGPFTPSSSEYRILNSGNAETDWFVTISDPGVGASPASGTLLPGEEVAVTLTVDQLQAANLASGSYFISVDFDEVGSSVPPVTRTVALNVEALVPGVTGSVITQAGITWTFSKDHEIGQFANGDWWVVGPVDVISIDPPSVVDSGGRTVHGSMINPSPRNELRQGYDSATYAQYGSPTTYSPQLNVALGVSSAAPLTLQPDESLVSTISVSAAPSRPQTSGASVLTVLPLPAVPGSFRPPYSGSDKTSRFNESDLDYSVLAQLPRIPGTPSLTRVENWFRRPWIDHVPIWVGRYIHPKENMPDYGREIGDQTGTGSLMLNLDFTDAEKRTLFVRYVQLGIDLFGVVQDGGKKNWEPNQGHMSGRKWPILFAGIALGDTEMSSIGFDATVAFGEDGQTFYVSETSPGVYNFGFGGYLAADVGTPEWGGFHSIRPSLDNKLWLADPYRLCCTANAWWGTVLSARIMGAQSLWNHDSLFDYQDRFEQENAARGISDFRLAWTRFPHDMWTAYRSQY